MTRTPRVPSEASSIRLLFSLALVFSTIPAPYPAAAQSEACLSAKRIDWGGQISGLSTADSNYFWDYLHSHDANAPQEWKNSYATDQRCKTLNSTLPNSSAAGEKYQNLINATDPAACEQKKGADEMNCVQQGVNDLDGPKAGAIAGDLGKYNPEYSKQLQSNLQGLEKIGGMDKETIRQVNQQQAKFLSAAGAALGGSDAASAGNALAGSTDKAATLNTMYNGNSAKGGVGSGAGAGSGSQLGNAAVGSGAATGGAMATPESEYASMQGGEAPPAPELKTSKGGLFGTGLFSSKTQEEKSVDTANDKVADDNSQLQDGNKAIQGDRADFKKNMDQEEKLQDQAAKDSLAAQQADSRFKAATDAYRDDPTSENKRRMLDLEEARNSAYDKKADSEQELAKRTPELQANMDKAYGDYTVRVAENQKALDDLQKDTFTRDTRKQMSDLDSENARLAQENAQLAKEEQEQPERSKEIDREEAINNKKIADNSTLRDQASTDWCVRYGSCKGASQPPAGVTFQRQLPPGYLVRPGPGTVGPNGDWSEKYEVIPPGAPYTIGGREYNPELDRPATIGGREAPDPNAPTESHYNMVVSKHTDPATGEITERQEITMPDSAGNRAPMQPLSPAQIQQHLPPGTTMGEMVGSRDEKGQWQESFRATPPGQAPGTGDWQVKITQQRDPATGNWVYQTQVTPIPPALAQKQADPAPDEPRYVAGPKPSSVAQGQPYYHQPQIQDEKPDPSVTDYMNSRPMATATGQERQYLESADSIKTASFDPLAQNDQIRLQHCAYMSHVAQQCSSTLYNLEHSGDCEGVQQLGPGFWNGCGNAVRDSQ